MKCKIFKADTPQILQHITGIATNAKTEISVKTAFYDQMQQEKRFIKLLDNDKNMQKKVEAEKKKKTHGRKTYTLYFEWGKKLRASWISSSDTFRKFYDCVGKMSPVCTSSCLFWGLLLIYSRPRGK